jgi:asparagine synthase (glutamine-hydrolysing)
MPGIVGLITKAPRERAERELVEMVETLCHEEFYVTGTYVAESLGVYVGWVAKRDSFSDRMPLRNERGDVTLIFSGEEFPKPGVGQRLRERGHDLQLTGPAYLVHLYEEDSSFPAGLNGRFQGLLIDRSRGTATLFNDRYGMHRLYCHQSEDAFYFAVEAKAILAVRPELREIDSVGMGEFIACGCVLEGRTLFKGIQLLPNGSKWVFLNGLVRDKGTYFNPSDWENQPVLGPSDFYRELRTAFSENLPRYFESPSRVGMSLTGGLDTRMIVAWHDADAGSIPCYTFGSMFRENHDVRVARRVATAWRQPFQVIETGEEFLRKFAHYAERSVYLTDGCVDVGRAPDLFVNEKARQIGTVRMTGNYGGEILRKVRTFKPVEPPAGLFDPDFAPPIAQIWERYTRLVSGNPASVAAFKQLPWNHYGVLALEETQLSMRAPFLDNDLVRAAIRAPEAALVGDGVCLRLIADGNKNFLAIPTDRGMGGERGRLATAASRAMLDFSFKAEYAYDMGMPQWVARIDHAFSRLRLERAFLGRHKIFHFRVWYRDELSKYVRDTLLSSRALTRPYVQRKRVEAIVNGHVTGNRNFTNEIHKLLTLEIVNRLFVDNQGARPRPLVSKLTKVVA